MTEMLDITFLGTGTSTGVPQIGCTCPVCRSTDRRDARLRSSVLVQNGQGRLIIDCGPDFRQQMLSQGGGRLDAAFLTHEHYDHVGGLDDLRPFNVFGDMRIYAEPYCIDHLRERLPYCFGERKYPGVPSLDLLPLSPGDRVEVAGMKVEALRVMHGRLPILGFRIGSLGYVTDAKEVPAESWERLRGVKVLIVNGLRFRPHHSHQTVDEAIALSREVGAQTTYIIHMSHDVGLHAEVEAHLPGGVHLAYDGLRISVPAQ